MSGVVTSTERLQRLLALVPYVVSRKVVGLAETAAAFGVSDLDALSLVLSIAELEVCVDRAGAALTFTAGEVARGLLDEGDEGGIQGEIVGEVIKPGGK